MKKRIKKIAKMLCLAAIPASLLGLSYVLGSEFVEKIADISLFVVAIAGFLIFEK